MMISLLIMTIIREWSGPNKSLVRRGAELNSYRISSETNSSKALIEDYNIRYVKEEKE